MAPLLAAVTGVMAMVVIAAWLSSGSIRFLSAPVLVLMKFNTAVSLLLAAVGLLAASRVRPVDGIVWAAGGALLILSLLTLSQHAFHVSLGIDQLIVTDHAQVRYPGRTSPVAATGFGCIGLALLLAIARRTSASQILFFLSAAAPLSILGGYLYNTPAPGTETITSIVAFAVSACMLALCLGGLFLRANTGAMRVVVSQSRAGLVARILMPTATAVPILAGLLIVAAGRSGMMSVESGSAMLVAFCAIFFTAAVWVTANVLWTAEREQRRVELQLRSSEYRRRMALESAELGTWSVDPATMRLDTDARFRDIFGVSADSLGYEEAVALIHPEDQAKVRLAVAESSRAVDPVPYDVEYRIVRADGSVRWVHAKGRANVLGAGMESDAVSFDGTIADVTARKQAETEREQLLVSERTARTAAERASRIKDEFLATLSHEIRTPLSAIVGWSQIMRRSRSAEDHAVGLEVIERNARAQTQIIEDLLDMSSIISGKVRLAVQELDLATLVHVAVDTSRPTADAKAIVIEVLVHPQDSFRMMGDASRIQQVLWNLLSNAIKFTPRGGRVQVSLNRVDSQLELIVTDSGEGISAEFLPFVFDRFRQADASTTRRHGGLGLGLSIVRQIAELHGGTVRATSPGLGQGATFVISLPITAVHERSGSSQLPGFAVASPSTYSPTAAPDINGVRILVVDDEPDARAMILRLLQEHGAIVTAAASAGEATQQLQRSRFDVLISDIGMPGEDGYSLIRRVRALPAQEGGALPAIALTAFARTEDRARTIAAGFSMHLAKPIEADELIAMIAALRPA